MTTVVTGAPRTGTSLILQTMDLLGVPMGMPKFIPEHDNMRQFNPNGFYEINSTEGVTDDRYKGKAIKLFGWQLFQSDINLIDKIIFVDRNREDAINSYEKVRVFLPHSEHSSAEIYDANKKIIEEFIDDDVMRITLEEIKKDSAKFVNNLISYLAINPTEEQMNNAIKNIH